jgi:hypothetical protein
VIVWLSEVTRALLFSPEPSPVQHCSLVRRRWPWLHTRWFAYLAICSVRTRRGRRPVLLLLDHWTPLAKGRRRPDVRITTETSYAQEGRGSLPVALAPGTSRRRYRIWPVFCSVAPPYRRAIDGVTCEKSVLTLLKDACAVDRYLLFSSISTLSTTGL